MTFPKNSMRGLRALACLGSLLMTAEGALIAHYTFDSDGSDLGTSGGTATIDADSAAITSSNFAVGTGALNLTGPTSGNDSTGGDGAVSANTFSWATDTRSIAFWMKAGTQVDPNPTMISLGGGSGNGTRFDVRLTGTALRLEVQGGGVNTSLNVGDGSWYHLTIVVPADGATVASTQYFVHNSSAGLVGSGSFTGSGTAIATGAGPLRIGDSYWDTGRDFIGVLDDVRLYDTALDSTDAAGLAAMFVPEPSSALLLSFGALGLLRRRRA
jgi:hypothetical protein